MPSIKDLRKRITTVKSTQQTTRAMKLVSASKLRRAQEAIVGQRPYARSLGGLFQMLAHCDAEAAESPYIYNEAQKVPDQSRKVLLVLVSSDRGLCGGFNSNIIKTAIRWVDENAKNYQEITLGFVGSKAYDYLKNKGQKIGPYYKDCSGKVNFLKAQKLAGTIQEEYLSGNYHEIKVVYNEFKNAIMQKPVVEDFLPLKQDPACLSEEIRQTTAVIIKPSAQVVFEALLNKYFSIQAFRILLESQASEHGARMSAMDSATKNADEMIHKLTLLYNKQRQAGITKELLEIISGTESQKV